MFTKSLPQIYYEKCGTGKPIILVHGNKEDHTIFTKLMNSLKNHFTIYAVDNRGHGKSDKTNTYHYNDMADDILRLIDELGLDKPYFYGFSDGGIIGILCAVKRENVFDKMILSGANITPKGLKSYIRVGIKLSYIFTRDNRTKMMLCEPNITAVQLQKITCPTLVLAGEFDMIAEKETKIIAQSIPNATLKILKGKNHSDYVVNSDFLKDIIIEFNN